MSWLKPRPTKTRAVSLEFHTPTVLEPRLFRKKQLPLCFTRPSRGRGTGKKKRGTTFGMARYFLLTRSQKSRPRQDWSEQGHKKPGGWVASRFSCDLHSPKQRWELFLVFLAVLVLVNFLAGFVLFLVDLFLFRRSQLAAVGFAVGLGLLIDGVLLLFHVSRFAGIHFTALDAFADALLLIFGALTDVAHRGIRGFAMICGGEVGAILTGRVFVGHLFRGRLNVSFICRSAFLGRGDGGGAAGAAVEAGADADVFMDHGAINESVVHDRGVYVDDCGVVREMSTAPFTAREAYAAVTESVINAAVEADVGTPVACMPTINATREAPVAGSPEDAYARRSDPDARNPVVACVTVGPIAGSPKKAFGGARRLHVNRNCWRAYVYGDAHRDLRRGRGRHAR